jgi:hypothetical protein
MANKKRKTKIHKVYNRKIVRNMLKIEIGSNKIKQAWKYAKSLERRNKLHEQRV